MNVKGISNESIVVPGLSDVIDRLSFKILLISVDLPTLGFPIKASLVSFISLCIDQLQILNNLSTNFSRPWLVFAETSYNSSKPSSENSNFFNSDFCLSHLFITKIILLLNFLKIEQISKSPEVIPSSIDVTNKITDDLLIASIVLS